MSLARFGYITGWRLLDFDPNGRQAAVQVEGRVNDPDADRRKMYLDPEAPEWVASPALTDLPSPPPRGEEKK